MEKKFTCQKYPLLNDLGKVFRISFLCTEGLKMTDHKKRETLGKITAN